MAAVLVPLAVNAIGIGLEVEPGVLDEAFRTGTYKSLDLQLTRKPWPRTLGWSLGIATLLGLLTWLTTFLPSKVLFHRLGTRFEVAGDGNQDKVNASEALSKETESNWSASPNTNCQIKGREL